MDTSFWEMTFRRKEAPVARPTKYPPEFRREAIELVLEREVLRRGGGTLARDVRQDLVELGEPRTRKSASEDGIP